MDKKTGFSFGDPRVSEAIEIIEQNDEHQARVAKAKQQMNAAFGKKRLLFVLSIVFMGIMAALMFLPQLGADTMTLYVLFFFVPILLFIPFALGKNATSVLKIYTETFLQPVFRSLFPLSRVSAQEGISVDWLRRVTPGSSKYEPSCYLEWRDEAAGKEEKTCFCNLYSHHTEWRGSGKHRHSEQVTDFLGQVLLRETDHTYSGRLRIVPTQKGPFGIEFQAGYVGRAGEEQKIETEDIVFNENYNVYATDELQARAFLNPHILRVFDAWAGSMPVAIFLADSVILASFYSGDLVLQGPQNKDEVESLTLSTVLQDIEYAFQDTYPFMNTLQEAQRKMR